MGDQLQVEFTVRSDRVDAVRRLAAERDRSVVWVVTEALRHYLAGDEPRPGFVDAPRIRLRLRLDADLLDELDERAARLGVGRRLLVEAALGPQRPSWNLGHRPRVSGTS